MFIMMPINFLPIIKLLASVRKKP